jgi:hypothetical protein
MKSRPSSGSGRVLLLHTMIHTQGLSRRCKCVSILFAILIFFAITTLWKRKSIDVIGMATSQKSQISALNPNTITHPSLVVLQCIERDMSFHNVFDNSKRNLNHLNTHLSDGTFIQYHGVHIRSTGVIGFSLVAFGSCGLRIMQWWHGSRLRQSYYKTADLNITNEKGRIRTRSETMRDDLRSAHDLMDNNEELRCLRGRDPCGGKQIIKSRQSNTASELILGRLTLEKSISKLGKAIITDHRPVTLPARKQTVTSDGWKEIWESGPFGMTEFKSSRVILSSWCK